MSRLQPQRSIDHHIHFIIQKLNYLDYHHLLFINHLLVKLLNFKLFPQSRQSILIDRHSRFVQHHIQN